VGGCCLTSSYGMGVSIGSGSCGLGVYICFHTCKAFGLGQSVPAE
jgi:hypothetical protein